jgi:AcrR family transcriptional regulator
VPKLSQKVIEGKKRNIEDAARQLFIKQGFHAASMRDIAARAGVSLGNLYNYYGNKEELFESIIANYQLTIDTRLREMFEDLDAPLETENMRRFGQSVKALVNQHADYWLLMYIDVLEFENRHFRKMFDGLAHNLRRRFNDYFQGLERKGALHDTTDPAFGFTAAYMQFFSYFLVERLFGGNQHFGLDDDQVIDNLTAMYCRGVMKQVEQAV